MEFLLLILQSEV